MAVRSVRGSGIGQVDTSSILPQNPSFSEQLSRIISGQQPLPIQQGLGINLTPLTGEPAILPSESAINPALAGAGMGMPDESSGMDIFGQNPTAIPFTQGLMDLFSSGSAARGEDVQVGSITDAAMLQAAQEEAAAAQANAAAQRAAGELTQKIEAQRAGKPIELGFTPTPTPKPEKPKDPQTSGAVAGTEDDPVKAATVTALDEYLKSARPGVTPDSYDKYIEEFQKATGLDVSGQPDKSTALMAFGLALMQNKAGKGFDVGEMLSAVGGAGEKALPELTKARAEARAIRAKAGEYALGRKKEDKAAAMSRQSIFVVPRKGVGKTPEDQLRDRLMKGRYIQVNSYELDALANAEGFDQNYEIMPGDTLGKMDNLFKAPESPYSDKMTDFTLFGGADDEFKVKTYAPKPGNTSLASKAISSTEIERAEAEINNGIDKLNSLDSKFSRFFESYGANPPTVWNQVGSYLIGLGRSFGVGLSDNFSDLSRLETDTQYQKRFSEYLATRYAPEILQEAGKTISDADRQRVQAIVGEISLFTDPSTTAAKMRDLHEFIILAGRKNMETAIVNLGRIGGTVQAPPLSEEEDRRYRQLVAQYNAAAPAEQGGGEEADE